MNKAELIFWRRERRLSQFELAAASGIPRWKIQMFEQGLTKLTKEEECAVRSALQIEEGHHE